MPHRLVILLLILSAVAQIFGTATVACNYCRGAQLAREVHAELDAEQATEGSEPGNMQRLLVDASEIMANFRLDDAIPAYRDRLRRLLSLSDPRWYLTAGIVFYIVGALLGLAAGIGALQ